MTTYFSAMPVVEHLATTIDSITKSYKQVCDKESRLASDLSLAQSQLFPLRKENARLARENYQLHVENVKQNEDKDALKQKHMIDMRHLEDQISELTYLSKISNDQLKRAETDRDKLREAFEAVAGKGAQGGTRRVIHLNNHLPPPASYNQGGNYDASNSSSFSSSGVQSHNADALIIESLHKQLDQANQQLKKLEDENISLNAKVVSRENELNRSSKQNTTGLDGDSLVSGTRVEQLVAADAANRRLIDQLNSHVDFLNEQLAMREAQLVEAADKILQAENLMIQNKQSLRLLDQERTTNLELNSQLLALQRKVHELTEAINPDSSVSVDELIESQSHRDDDSLAVEAPFRSSKGNVDVSLNSTDVSVEVVEKKVAVTKPATNASKEKSVTTTAAATKPVSKVASKPSNNVSNQAFKEREAKATRDTDAMLTKLNTERDSLLGNVSNLSETVESLQKGENVLKERLRRSEEKINELKQELTDTKHTLVSMSQNIADKDRVLKQLQGDIQDKDTLIATLSTRASSNISSNDQLQEELQAVKDTLIAVTRDRDQCKQLQEATQQDLTNLRKERIDLVGNSDDLKAKYASLVKEVEASRQAIDRYVNELGVTKGELVKVNMLNEKLDNDFSSATKRADNAIKYQKELEDKLLVRTNELQEASHRVVLLQNTVASVDVVEQLRNDIKDLRSKLTAAEDAKEKIQREKDALVMEARMTSSLSQQQLHKNIEMDEVRAQANHALLVKEEEMSKLRQTIRTLQMDVDRAEASSRTQEDINRKLKAALDDRQSQMRYQSSTTGEMRSDMQILEHKLAETEEACLRAKEQCRDAINGQGIALEKATKLEYDLATALDRLLLTQNEKVSLENQCDNYRKQIDQVSQRALADRDELRQAVADKNSLEVKVSELKVLVKNMEVSANSYAQKSTRLSAKLEEDNVAMSEVRNEMSELRSCISNREETIRDLKEALQNLDDERDSLQNQLDAMVEQFEQRELVRKNQEQQILSLKKINEMNEKKLQGCSGDVTAMQKTCAALEGRINALKEENLELQRKLAQRNTEIGGTSEDLMLMTKENQALTHELAEITADRDRLRLRITEVVQSMSSLEQSRRAIELERSDLLESYRAVLQEKRKMESELHSLSAVKQRAGASVQQLHGQVAELRGVVNANASTESRWNAERVALNRQLETLNEELVRTQQKVDAVEADNRRLMQDAHGLRQTNAMLNERVQMVIKRATAAADANKILSSRLLSTERERDAMRSLVSVERQKSTDLSSLVEAARVTAATKDIQLQKLRVAGDSTSTSVDNIHMADTLGISNEDDSLDK